MGEALDRLKKFEAELPNLDAPMRAQLISAWKEQILDDLIDLFKRTDDPRDLSNVDRAIALSMEIVDSQNLQKEESGNGNN